MSAASSIVPRRRLIGTAATAQAAPDGYTLTTSSTAGELDPMKDFTHIAYVGGPPRLVVNPGIRGARSLKELVELGGGAR